MPSPFLSPAVRGRARGDPLHHRVNIPRPPGPTPTQPILNLSIRCPNPPGSLSGTTPSVDDPASKALPTRTQQPGPRQEKLGRPAADYRLPLTTIKINHSINHYWSSVGSGLVFGDLRCSFGGVRLIGAAVVDPQLNRPYGVVRHWVETNWHAGELRIRTGAERRLAFQGQDQIRVRSVAEHEDRLSEQLRSDELIPSDIAPEGVVWGTHLSFWTTDRRVQDIYDLTKGVDVHLFSPIWLRLTPPGGG